MDFSWLINRLSETSTWQAIAVGLGTTFHFTLPPDVQTAAISACVAFFVLLGVIKRDSKSPDAKVSPQAVQNGRNLQ
jgi:hypothetical protein